jgi:uncharacterized membrane protein YbaN (DUF454 family)
MKLDAASKTKTIETVQSSELPYPSLNEVNFLAFSEISEEYHNELYGHIEFKEKLNDFKESKVLMDYKKLSTTAGRYPAVIKLKCFQH